MELILHLFFPHHTNNYRAKSLHMDSLLVYAIAIAAFQLLLTTIHKSAPDILGYATDITTQALLSETNAKRIENGLNPLQYNEQLSHAAYLKAQHMFQHNYWAHTGTDGKTPWDFISSSGYQYSYAGENLAKNFMTSPQVVQAWIDSPSHRDNIMKSNYTDIGFAVVNGVLQGEETTLIVQMFGTPYQLTVKNQPEREISEQAASTELSSKNGSQPRISTIAGLQKLTSSHSSDAFSGFLTSVVYYPLINMKTVQFGVVGGVVLFLLSILIIDTYVAHLRRHTRAVGHQIGHIFFLIGVLAIGIFMTTGSIL